MDLLRFLWRANLKLAAVIDPKRPFNGAHAYDPLIFETQINI